MTKAHRSKHVKDPLETVRSMRGAQHMGSPEVCTAGMCECPFGDDICMGSDMHVT